MAKAVEDLLSILDLEKLEHNLFRGVSPKDGWQRVFGGQVIGQALVAASATVGTERAAHSLHVYFVRPGDPAVPIIYQVETIRDGRSFATRRVVAIQHGRPIFFMSASFQVSEPEGLAHRAPMPDVPPPEALQSETEMKRLVMEFGSGPVKEYWSRERPIEIRPVSLGHYVGSEKLEPLQYAWIRSNGSLPDEPAIHKAVLAYASDFLLLDTSLYPHGRSLFDRDLQVASLDHAMWFHRPFRADAWLLYAMDSPSAGYGRGFNRGSIFTSDGEHIASVAQEGLIRIVEPRPDRI